MVFKNLGRINLVRIITLAMTIALARKIALAKTIGLTCEEGGVNVAKLWKLKKQLRGIWQEPPTAMLDSSGNLVTTSKALETLSLQMYKERLTGHEIKEGLNLHKVQREKLFEQ